MDLLSAHDGKVHKTAVALQKVRDLLTADSTKMGIGPLHVRSTDDGQFEFLLEEPDGKHHFFFAYHNGGAYPRAKTA